ncbi:MAG: thiolase family protein [Elusimicrobia bacterium]|nr:thiolase family protein [Elusimicrobiota bacterium]
MAVCILEGARTPFSAWAHGRRGDGEAGGLLKSLDPFELGAAALRGALRRSKVRAEDLELLVFANMYQAGPHASYGGRYVGWKAAVPPEVPGLSVSMACASGLWSVICASQNIQAGVARIVGAAGADTISQVGRLTVLKSFLDASCDEKIGATVEELAKEYKISRAAQDDWALQSHLRARQAQDRGILEAEIEAVGSVRRDDSVLTLPLPDHFKSSQPLHGSGGGVTRANTHALVDGGSALVMADEEAARSRGLKLLGRLVAYAFSGTPPRRMGVASVPAVRKALEGAGLRVDNVDLFEINETFAAQLLIDLRELGIPPDRVNVNGGAIALGHPFAATGGRQLLSLLLELRRRKLRYGVAAICVGGGQGAAVVVESV